MIISRDYRFFNKNKAFIFCNNFSLDKQETHARLILSSMLSAF